jgi:hypothetical protein
MSEEKTEIQELEKKVAELMNQVRTKDFVIEKLKETIVAQAMLVSGTGKV